MPEICEILLTTEMLQFLTKNYLLVSYEILAGLYFENRELPGKDDFYKDLPLSVNKVSSRGKLFWFEFQKFLSTEKSYLIMKFQMTGRLSLHYIKDAHIVFTFYHPTTRKIVNVWWGDTMKIGHVTYTRDKSVLKKLINALGIDPVRDEPDEEALYILYRELASKKKWQNKPIVALLLDQCDFLCGIGNYLSAEILYEAKISPLRKVSQIDQAMFSTLWRAIRLLIRRAYLDNTTHYLKDLDFGPQRFNPFPELGRVGKLKFKVYGQKKKDPDGNPIAIKKIVKGRSTYYSPTVQL
jgi:formamidopyrimidine-DNA glycosylase